MSDDADDLSTTEEQSEHPAIDSFLEAARVVGRVYQGCGDTVDAHRMLGLMIMVEHFISGGGDAACEKMGWDVRKKETSVTALEVVRNIAAKSPPPQDR